MVETFQRRCVSCGATNDPLEIEHSVPQARGGSHRVSNLALACHPGNQAKGNQPAEEFGQPAVQALAQTPLRDGAAVNASCWALSRRLTAWGLPVETGRGDGPRGIARCATCPRRMGSMPPVSAPVPPPRGRGTR